MNISTGRCMDTHTGNLDEFTELLHLFTDQYIFPSDNKKVQNVQFPLHLRLIQSTSCPQTPRPQNDGSNL